MMNKVPDGTRYRSAEVRSVIITHHHFDHWLMVNSERTARVRWKKSDRLFWIVIWLERTYVPICISRHTIHMFVIHYVHTYLVTSFASRSPRSRRVRSFASFILNFSLMHPEQASTTHQSSWIETQLCNNMAHLIVEDSLYWREGLATSRVDSGYPLSINGNNKCQREGQGSRKERMVIDEDWIVQKLDFFQHDLAWVRSVVDTEANSKYTVESNRRWILCGPKCCLKNVHILVVNNLLAVMQKLPISIKIEKCDCGDSPRGKRTEQILTGPLHKY